MNDQKSSPLTSVLSPARGEADKDAPRSRVERSRSRLSLLTTGKGSNLAPARGEADSMDARYGTAAGEMGRLSSSQEERGRVRSCNLSC